MKIGDSVRVKSGIMDPEFEKYDMAGWQGRIVAIDTTEKEFIEIAWDSITLGMIPAEYIERSIDDYWDFSSIWLNNNEVELIEPRDTMNEVENKLLEIRH